MKIHKTLMTAAFLLVFMMVCPSAYAQDEVSGSDEWEFQVTPYFFAPAVDGDSTVDGGTVELDLDFGDVLDDFDVFGLSGRFEAWKGDWGFIVDGMYVDLDGDFDFPLPIVNEVGVDIEQFNLDFAVSRRLATMPLREDSDIPWVSFEAIGGARYVDLKQEIRPKPALPVPAPKLGGSEDWVEPFVGGRITLALSEKWNLLARGDVGGFGIGSASDLTWNLLIGARYRFSQRASLVGGYRIFDIDYERGSGANEFAFDAQLDGPQIGVTIYF
jgi:opacity protein-like surface antigen